MAPWNGPKNVNSFPRHVGRQATPIYISVALSASPAYIARRQASASQDGPHYTAAFGGAKL